MPNMNDAPREVTNSAARSMHPMLIIAAGAVTLFCGVGIAMMTGIIPSAHSQKSDTALSSNAPSMPVTPAAATAAMGSASEAALPENKAENKTPAQQAPAKSEKTVVAHKHSQPNSQPSRMASSSPSSSREREPTPVYAPGANNGYDNQPTRVAAYEPPVCRNCGTVDSIAPIAKQGEGSGAGAVLGGVLGGVLGHQVGGGRGKDLATVAGAVGGAFLGNTVEKNAKTSSVYDVRVRLEDGTFQTLRYETEPGVRIGDKVKIENGRAVRS